MSYGQRRNIKRGTEHERQVRERTRRAYCITKENGFLPEEIAPEDAWAVYAEHPEATAGYHSGEPESVSLRIDRDHYYRLHLVPKQG